MNRNILSSEDRLKNANLRTTRHRVRVLDVLAHAGRPMSHLEILEILGDARLDRVTLYRILATLKDASLIHQVQGSDGIWRFCSHDENAPSCPGGHPHLQCECCGRMQCLTSCKMQHVDVPEDFKVTHKQMLIIGICSDCIKKSDKNST